MCPTKLHLAFLSVVSNRLHGRDDILQNGRWNLVIYRGTSRVNRDCGIHVGCPFYGICNLEYCLASVILLQPQLLSYKSTNHMDKYAGTNGVSYNLPWWCISTANLKKIYIYITISIPSILLLCAQCFWKAGVRSPKATHTFSRQPISPLKMICWWTIADGRCRRYKIIAYIWNKSFSLNLHMFINETHGMETGEPGRARSGSLSDTGFCFFWISVSSTMPALLHRYDATVFNQRNLKLRMKTMLPMANCRSVREPFQDKDVVSSVHEFTCRRRSYDGVIFIMNISNPRKRVFTFTKSIMNYGILTSTSYQALNIPVLDPEYSGWKNPIPWLLMTWGPSQ